MPPNAAAPSAWPKMREKMNAPVAMPRVLQLDSAWIATM